MSFEQETLLERTMGQIHENIERLEQGNMNCIPYPFERSRKDFPGIERRCYYCIMANTKVGKSQFMNDVFVFEPIMEMYYGSSDLKVNILYCALEETPERIMQRFMAWLLYRESRGKIRVSPRQIRSTLHKCPQEALDMLEDEHIKDILQFFEEHVTFLPSTESNPTGIYNYCRTWAEKRGTVIYKEYEVEDEFGEKHTNRVFERYIPDDPNEFNIVIIDPINRVETERNMDERRTMRKLSEYCYKYLRNDYLFSIVIVQQQTFSNFSLDAKKVNRFEPNMGDAGGSKEILQDVDVAMSLYNPSEFEVDSYGGYDIRKLGKRSRFVKYMAARDGEGSGITPLFFDGTCAQFYELPKPGNASEMQSVYNYCEQMNMPHTADELAALNPFIKKYKPEQQQPKEGKITGFINLLFSH